METQDRSIDAGMTIADQVEIERLEEQASNLRKVNLNLYFFELST